MACTAAGRRLETDCREVSERMAGIYYEGLGADEIRVFEGTLARILSNLERAERG